MMKKYIPFLEYFMNSIHDKDTKESVEKILNYIKQEKRIKKEEHLNKLKKVIGRMFHNEKKNNSEGVLKFRDIFGDTTSTQDEIYVISSDEDNDNNKNYNNNNNESSDDDVIEFVPCTEHNKASASYALVDTTTDKNEIEPPKNYTETELNLEPDKIKNIIDVIEIDISDNETEKSTNKNDADTQVDEITESNILSSLEDSNSVNSIDATNMLINIEICNDVDGKVNQVSSVHKNSKQINVDDISICLEDEAVIDDCEKFVLKTEGLKTYLIRPKRKTPVSTFKQYFPKSSFSNDEQQSESSKTISPGFAKKSTANNSISNSKQTSSELFTRRASSINHSYQRVDSLDDNISDSDNNVEYNNLSTDDENVILMRQKNNKILKKRSNSPLMVKNPQHKNAQIRLLSESDNGADIEVSSNNPNTPSSEDLSELYKLREHLEHELQLPQKPLPNTNNNNNSNYHIPAPCPSIPNYVLHSINPHDRSNNKFMHNKLPINPNDPRFKSRLELLKAPQKELNDSTKSVSKETTLPLNKLPTINPNEILDSLGYKPEIPIIATAKKDLNKTASIYDEYRLKRKEIEEKKKTALEKSMEKNKDCEIADTNLPSEIVSKIVFSESSIDKMYRDNDWNLSSKNSKDYKIPKKCSTNNNSEKNPRGTSPASAQNTEILPITNTANTTESPIKRVKKLTLKKKRSISSNNSNSAKTTSITNTKKTNTEEINVSSSKGNTKSKKKKRIEVHNSDDDFSSSSSNNSIYIKRKRKSIRQINSETSTDEELSAKLSFTDDNSVNNGRKSTGIDFESILENVKNIDKKAVKQKDVLLVLKSLFKDNEEQMQKLEKVVQSKHKDETSRTKYPAFTRELRQLNEDIDNMYDRDQVLGITGKRQCTIKTNEKIKDNLSKKRYSDDECNITETILRKKLQNIKNRRKSCAVERFQCNETSDEEMPQPDNIATLTVPPLARKQLEEGEVHETDDYSASLQAKESYNKLLHLKEARIYIKKLTQSEIDFHCMKKSPSKKKSSSDSHSHSPSQSTTEQLLQPLKATELPFEGSLSKKQNNTKKLGVNNIDKMNNCLNPNVQKRCLICHKVSKNIVSHYANTHIESEVLIARLPESSIQKFKLNRNYGFLLEDSATKYRIYCLFCADNCISSIVQLYEHYASHTGEFAYQCNECGVEYPFQKQIQQHCRTKCSIKNVRYNQMYAYYKELVIVAHFCTICNYIQLNRANIERHLKSEHNIFTNYANHLEELVLVELKNENLLAKVAIENEIINEEMEEQPLTAQIDHNSLSLDTIVKEEEALEIEKLSISANGNENNLIKRETFDHDLTEINYRQDLNANINTVIHVPLTLPNKIESDSENSRPPSMFDDETEVINEEMEEQPLTAQIDHNSLSLDTIVKEAVALEIEKLSISANGNENNLIKRETFDHDLTEINYRQDLNANINTVIHVPLTLPIESDSENSRPPSIFDDETVQDQDIKDEEQEEDQEEDQNFLTQDQPIITSTMSTFPKIFNETISIEKNPPENAQFTENDENTIICLDFDDDDDDDDDAGGNNLINNKETALSSQEIIKELQPETTLSTQSYTVSKIPSTVNNMFDIRIENVESQTADNENHNLLKPWLRIKDMTEKQYEESKKILIDVNLYHLFKCVKCSFSTNSILNANGHYLKHITKKTVKKGGRRITEVFEQDCPYCTMIFTVPQELADHIQTQHRFSIYQCSMCFYRSCSAFSVRCHQSLSHVSNTKIHNILLCNGPEHKVIKEFEEMILSRSKFVQPYTCHLCNDTKKFYLQSCMEKHFKNLHNNAIYCMCDKHEFFACIYCVFEAPNTAIMMKHLVNCHSDKGLYACARKLNNKYKEEYSEKPESTVLISFGELINSKYIKVDTNLNSECPQRTDNYLKRRKEMRICASNCGEQIIDRKNINTEKQVTDEQLDDKSINIQDLQIEFEKLARMAVYNTGVTAQKLYKCSVSGCEEILFNFELWKNHIQNTHKIWTEKYQCPHCMILYPMVELINHFSKHAQHKYFCYLCSSTDVTYNAIERHLSKDHGIFNARIIPILPEQYDERYYAVIKSGVFFDGYALTKHMCNILRFNKIVIAAKENIHLIEDIATTKFTTTTSEFILKKNQNKCIPIYVPTKERYHCNYMSCKHKPITETALENHFNTIHRRFTSFSCHCCNFNIPHEVKTFRPIKDHLRMHAENIFVCCKCNLSNHMRQVVSKHVWNAHKTEMNITKINRKIKDDKLICDYDTCLADGSNILRMEYCIICGEKIPNSDKIDEHLITVHQCNVVYQCRYCKELRTTRSDICNHILENHNQTMRIRCLYAIEYSLDSNSATSQLSNISEVNVTEISKISPTKPITVNNLNTSSMDQQSSDASNIQSTTRKRSREHNNSSSGNSTPPPSISSTNIKKLKIHEKPLFSDFSMIQKASTSSTLKVTETAISSTTTANMLQCDDCDYKTELEGELINHKTSNHYDKENNAEQQQQNHYGGFSCEWCKYFCDTVAELKDHKFKNHSNSIMKIYCSNCKFVCVNYLDLHKHKVEAHPNDIYFLCEICNVFFDSFEKLKIHHKNKHDIHIDHLNQYHCTHCNYVTENFVDLKHHAASTHIKIIGKYKCVKCAFNCDSSSELHEHRVFSHAEYFIDKPKPAVDVAVATPPAPVHSKTDHVSSTPSIRLVPINLLLQNPIKSPSYPVKTNQQSGNVLNNNPPAPETSNNNIIITDSTGTTTNSSCSELLNNNSSNHTIVKPSSNGHLAGAQIHSTENIILPGAADYLNRVTLADNVYPYKDDLIYVCDHCHIKVVEMKYLIQHWQENHTADRKLPFQFTIERRLRCGRCNYTGSFQDIKLHHIACHHLCTLIVQRNTDDECKYCVECNFKFVNIDCLDSHIANVHPNLIHQPDLSYNFVTPDLLNVLLKIGYIAITYKCDHCGYSFLEENLCYQHLNEKHALQSQSITRNWQTRIYYGCTECQIFYDNQKNGFIHYRQEHTKPYLCVICSEGHHSYNTLQKHYQEIHQTFTKNYNCTNILDSLECYTKNLYILFPNGLVMSLYDLSETPYGAIKNIQKVLNDVEKTEFSKIATAASVVLQ